MTDPMLEALIASGLAEAVMPAVPILEKFDLDKLFTWDDEDTNAAIEHEWLIKEILSRRGVSMLWGPSGGGKGFTGLEIAACVMSGEPFYGNRIKAPGGVMLALGEGASSIALRMNALRLGRFNGVAPADPVNGGSLDLKKLPIAWFEVSYLSKDAEFNAFAASIRKGKMMMEERTGRPLRLVILDTMNAAFNFDDDPDAAKATNNLKKLSVLGIELDLLFLVIHHAGKSIDAGETGSHAIRASVEESLLVNGKKDNQTGLWSDRRFVVIKARDGSKEGWSQPFDLQSVDLGVDSDGDPKTSMITVAIGGGGANDNASASPQQNRKTKPVDKFLEAFDLVFKHAAQDYDIDGRLTRACKKSDVQAEYLNQNDGNGNKRDSVTRYFRDAAKAAKVEGMIFESGHYVWPFFQLLESEQASATSH